MAQIVSRGKPGTVVTVAELMRRCTPAPEPLDDDDAAPIPVAALLRREGRSAAGLPVPAVGEILSALPVRQPLQRRCAIAAGALLAAGSVLGLTAAMNGKVPPPSSTGTYPGQADTAPSFSAALDAGAAAPTAWLPVAFPTLFTPADAAPAAHRATAVASGVTTRTAATTGGSVVRSASTAGPPATTSPTSKSTEKAGSSSGVVGGTTDTVGDTVRDVGTDTPLQGVTDTVGDTAAGVGHTVDNTVSGVGHTVDNTVSGVGHTVNNTVSGVGHTVDNTVSGLGGTLDNTVSGPGNTASGLGHKVGAATAPLTERVAAPLKTVNTSSKSAPRPTSAVTKTVNGLLGG